MKYAEVVVDVPIYKQIFPEEEQPEGEEGYNPLAVTFHYSIPPHLMDSVAVGQLVKVPFGPRSLQGIVVGLSDTSPVAETRDIEEVLEPKPVLTPVQIELARWISSYYLAPLRDCLRLMLPPGLARRSKLLVQLKEEGFPSDLSEEERAVVEFLRRRGEVELESLSRDLGIPEPRSLIDGLERRGIVTKRWGLSEPEVKPRRERFLRLIAKEDEIAEELPDLGYPSKQAKVLEALAASDPPLLTLSEVLARAGCSESPVYALAEKGLVEITERRRLVAPLIPPSALDRAIAQDLRNAPKQAEVLSYLRLQPAPVEVSRIDCPPSVLKELERKGYVQRIEQERMVILRLSHPLKDKLIELRRLGYYIKVLDFLRVRGGLAPLSEVYAETGCSLHHLRRLAERNLVRIEEMEVWRGPLVGREFVLASPPKLTPDQEAVWEEVKEMINQRTARGKGRPFVALLHGVTGSGKTEIYLQALEEVLALGRQAIVLVPEISLTPQTIRRFAARFPARLAVLHSKLSPGERYDEWRRIRDGLADVVIGPRSAIFAPLPRLGLIVVDEEHSDSYKQEKTPRYHARDVAIKLAELSGSVVILGSATPDLVSYYRAQRGEYKLLRLPKRIMGHRRKIEEQRERYEVRATRYKEVGEGYKDALYLELPPVQVVDMRQELKAGNRSIFSRALQKAMKETLDRNQQVILFLNRRGAATFVMCRDCGYVLKCPRCEVPLTYHATEEELICHHCNRHYPTPEVCPNCGSSRIRYFGLGTQRVEAAVRRSFPHIRTLRWDRDTTGGKLSHEELLADFVNHEADVLIGTQMIAKGLDLPLVTLVGVVSADTALHLPDFRAAERTFQLLTQVAGRAGRSILGGKVIIQTYTPEHYSIRMASQHDYQGFYERELEFRRQHGYPPFKRLAKLVYYHSNRERCQEEAERVYRILANKIARLGLPGVDLIGPVPCFFSKVRGRYRWQIVIRAPEPQVLLRDMVLPLGWQVDVDPLNTL